MKKITISDRTIFIATQNNSLTFREKLDLATKIDKLSVDAIELGFITSPKADSLFVKSASTVIKNSIVCVSTNPSKKSIDEAFTALAGCEKKRLQICAPVSTARMEYVFHKKQDEELEDVAKSVSYAVSLCDDVEFVADDATRADWSFLCKVIDVAVKSGARYITLCDSAGTMLPDEMKQFIEKILLDVPSLSGKMLGISCLDTINLSSACAIAAINAGATSIKVACRENLGLISLSSISKILQAKGDSIGANCQLQTTALKKTLSEIAGIFDKERTGSTPFENGVRKVDSETVFTNSTTLDELATHIRRLGYDLDENDLMRVYSSFKNAISKKDSLGDRELEVILAAETSQAPLLYTLESYIVTTGNTIDVMAHVKIKKGEELIDGMSIGDGPIDAALLAIEKIIGRHYELDDFQVQAITEGREAMGQTIVKLRSGGNIYSGIGISTDIIGSSIKAYINALNKIAHEESA